MFIGHFAVAFGIKRAAPEVGLGTAIVAALFLDLVWPVLVAAGIEAVKIDPRNTALSPLDFVSYPYSMRASTAATMRLQRGPAKSKAVTPAASRWRVSACCIKPRAR